MDLKRIGNVPALLFLERRKYKLNICDQRTTSYKYNDQLTTNGVFCFDQKKGQ